VPVWKHHPVDYTHMHTDHKSTSTLDHFLISPRLLPLVDECGPLHRGDNLSRHSPIFLRIRLGELPAHRKIPSQVPRRPAWARAVEQQLEQYTAALQEKLLLLQVPESLNCDNTNCQNHQHTEDRDSFLLTMLSSMIETSYSCIPVSGGGSSGKKDRTARGGIPGWKEEVEPFRQQANYWWGVWVAEGRPSTGWLHDTMVKRRTQYHYAVRRVRRRNQEIRARKLFESSMMGDRELMKEMKKVRTGGSSGQTELPDRVEGADGEEEIVEKFREVYSALYTSAGTQPGMEALGAKVATLITPEAVSEVTKLTGSVVKNAVTKMKPRKSDVSGSFSSDALLHSPDIMFDQLALVFRSWLVHGTVTSSVLSCAFLPLLKSSLKDPAATSSYRAIAGSSLILKIFEKSILLLWGRLLTSDSLQFGYKEGASSTQATWLVQEVVQHYLRCGSHPLVGVLDCSKAFDLAKWDTMFSRLLERGMPPVVVRAMMFMYEEQYAWVRWGKTRSEQFSILNGTRQGSMASPALWSVYCDPLLARLRALGVGCHLGGLYMGAIMYCDDLILLAPTRRALVLMMEETEKFAEE
jgi:hypothetical protein